MHSVHEQASTEKPAFEPSVLVEYGDAERITQNATGMNFDGTNYVS